MGVLGWTCAQGPFAHPQLLPSTLARQTSYLEGVDHECV